MEPGVLCQQHSAGGWACNGRVFSIACKWVAPAADEKTVMCGIAGVFGGFQALMPMIGWICVHTLLRVFEWFEKLIPWIALFLLYISWKDAMGRTASGR